MGGGARALRRARLSGATQTLLEETYFDSDADWRRIDADWLSAAADLALNLDSDTNNTSLVLAFEWKDRVLLFVGDAQVGNWLSWRDQTYRAERGRSVPVDHLLARTVLYKVGHHGSHNATLKRDPRTATSDSPFGGPYGLELMRDIIALIPVDRAAAEKDMPSPWEMPHQPLYERLLAIQDRARERGLRLHAFGWGDSWILQRGANEAVVLGTVEQLEEWLDEREHGGW